jgi:acyl dehydratase
MRLHHHLQTKLDLLRDFMHITETDIHTAAAVRRDASTMHIDKHTVDTPTYNARILARLLFGSITDDFSITILHRVPGKIP